MQASIKTVFSRSLVIGLALLLNFAAQAQIKSGAITGTVTDAASRLRLRGRRGNWF